MYCLPHGGPSSGGCAPHRGQSRETGQAPPRCLTAECKGSSRSSIQHFWLPEPPPKLFESYVLGNSVFLNGKTSHSPIFSFLWFSDSSLKSIYCHWGIRVINKDGVLTTFLIDSQKWRQLSLRYFLIREAMVLLAKLYSVQANTCGWRGRILKGTMGKGSLWRGYWHILRRTKGCPGLSRPWGPETLSWALEPGKSWATWDKLVTLLPYHCSAWPGNHLLIGGRKG